MISASILWIAQVSRQCHSRIPVPAVGLALNLGGGDAVTGKHRTSTIKSGTKSNTATTFEQIAKDSVSVGTQASIEEDGGAMAYQPSRLRSPSPAMHHVRRGLPALLATVMLGDLQSIQKKKSSFRSNDSIEEYHPLTRRTPVIIAAACGYDDVLEYLLQAGAKISSKDRDGRTDLHHAAAEGNTACTSLLLSKGALPDTEDSLGETPSHLACHYGRVLDVEMLLNHQMDLLSKMDRIGRNALHIAAVSGHANIMRIICDHIQMQACQQISLDPIIPINNSQKDEDSMNPHLDDKANFGQTPLALAVHLGNRDAVALLLEHGANFAIQCCQYQKCLLEEAVEIFTASILDHP